MCQKTDQLNSAAFVSRSFIHLGEHRTSTGSATKLHRTLCMSSRPLEFNPKKPRKQIFPLACILIGFLSLVQRRIEFSPRTQNRWQIKRHIVNKGNGC